VATLAVHGRRSDSGAPAHLTVGKDGEDVLPPSCGSVDGDVTVARGGPPLPVREGRHWLGMGSHAGPPSPGTGEGAAVGRRAGHAITGSIIRQRFTRRFDAVEVPVGIRSRDRGRRRREHE